MGSTTYYKRMFLIGAIFNLIGGIGFLFGQKQIEALTGASNVIDPLGRELFCAFVIVFGVGYWIVSLDISRNHGIVVLGIVGKLAAVSIIMRHAIAGDVPMTLAAPLFGDLIFAGLFAEFLLNGRGKAAIAAQH